ncbi:alpha/beta hydrolase [Leptolyngbya sp. AN02str]|uniref:alpha/beta hydrolase n=1 Tax=Leptolyngbya sp. AN02str TaxID=3423363 RepID=UPI003D30EF80
MDCHPIQQVLALLNSARAVFAPSTEIPVSSSEQNFFNSIQAQTHCTNGKGYGSAGQSPAVQSSAGQNPAVRSQGLKPLLKRWCSRVGSSLLLSSAAVLGMGGHAAHAAEELALKLGPIQQTIAIQDLKTFAETGRVPASLWLYAPLMTPEVQQAIGSHLPLESHGGGALVDELLSTSAGERLLKTLNSVIPNSTQADLQQALARAAASPEGLSFLGFVAEFPHQKMVIDLSAGIRLASQMNLPYWQSKALSSILERELTVADVDTLETDLNPAERGRQWVRQQTMYFRDRDRHRSIPVDIYWARKTSGPLIVLSHGFGADRRFLGYLAYHLASHGFTVVALEHPRSNVTWLSSVMNNQFLYRNVSDILPASEFVDRPQDVSFLLSELEQLNHSSRYLKGRFNTEQVTVIGHSLGGYTALALAGAQLDLQKLDQFCDSASKYGLSVSDWLQCTATDLAAKDTKGLSDRRVKRIIALNPVVGRLFNPNSIANIRIPVLITSSTSDAITPAVSQQLLPFAQLQTEQKYLLTAIGATHLSVGDPENLNHALTDSLFIRERPNHETEAMRTLTKGVALSFIKQDTPDAHTYHPFLSEAYAQSLSTADLKLRLNSTLSTNLSKWLGMAALPLEQMTLMPSPPQPRQGLTLNVALLGVTGLLASVPVVLFILPGNWRSPNSRLFRRDWYRLKRDRSNDTDQP